MKFLTHNQTDVNTTGVRWSLATIQATRDELVKAFGEPVEGDPGRVACMWALQFEDGTVATIYDWKEGPFQPDTIISWHIGALATRRFMTPQMVHDAFRAALGLSVRAA